MTSAVMKEIQRAAKEAPQIYFAPLIGAVRGIRVQYAKLGKKAPALGTMKVKTFPSKK